MKLLKDAGSLHGKKVLLRLDFNVPIIDGKVADEYRIIKSFPTLDYLRKEGARTIIVSHIESEEKTLKPVAEYLSRRMHLEFVQDYLDGSQFPEIPEGGVVLCENIRKFPGETKNDLGFAKSLAALAEMYVNDAFAVSHRAHASVVGVTYYLPSYAGFLVESEIAHLTEAMQPEKPFLFILGGAKFDTKIPLINKFAAIADKLFVGGALSNNLFKAAGYEVGTSLVSDGDFGEKELLQNPNIVIPPDVTVRKEGSVRVAKPHEIEKGESVADCGPDTVAMLKELVMGSKTVLWNGPLGNYENGFKEHTLSLARIIAECGCKSIVGGGDTLAAIKELGIEDKFYFVSTGGGAMLDFLANDTLPAIEALDKNAL